LIIPLLLPWGILPVQAQDLPESVAVRIPAVSARPGDRILIPVILSGLGDHEIVSGEIRVTFDPDLLWGEDPVRQGSLLEGPGWFTASRIDSAGEVGQYQVVFAAAQGFTESGDLVFLAFQVSEEAVVGITTALELVDASLNNGIPEAQTTHGTLTVIPLWAGIDETTPAAGLSGVTSVGAGDEVLLFSIGLTGDGEESVSAVTLLLADISTPTGITRSDFTELRLYRSTDAALDGDDVRIGTASQGSIQIGSPTTIAAGTPDIPPRETERFYLISAQINTSVTDGHAFKVGFAAGGVSTRIGGRGTAVTAGDADKVRIEVDATQLVFTTMPGGSVSGYPLATQPVVAAQDAAGNRDVDFGETVTLTESSAGGLTNPTVTASRGVATFSQVSYTATADQQWFTLTANDEDGTGTDLPTVNAPALTADVVATQLVWVTPPSGSVSGQPLSPPPVVMAQDDNGVTDTDFRETVTLTESAVGRLRNYAVTAASGVVRFSDLTYTAVADGESFTLTANDEDGVGFDLPTVNVQALTADVVATQLVFTTQPAPLNGISGSVLDFSTDPVVEARDASGVIDTDFTDTVTLTETGMGSASYTNHRASAVAGVATFPGLTVTYQAKWDGEGFGLQADDTTGGGEGDLLSVTSKGILADVAATRLVFSSPPPRTATTHTDFSGTVRIEAQDAAGAVDFDFSEAVTLTAVRAADVSTAGSGILSSSDAGGRTQTAASGTASWVDLKYDAVERIVLRATSSGFAAGSGQEAYSPPVTLSPVPPDADGTLTAAPGVREPVDLPSTANDVDTAVDVLDFTLRDGGGGDGYSLEVSQIGVHTWGDGPFSQVTFRLNGAGANPVVGTYRRATNTLTFDGLSISVADGDSETYTIDAYYHDNTGLTENQTLGLRLDGDGDLTVSGTQMSGANAAVSNGTGSPVSVEATQLVWVTLPADTSVVDTANDEVVSGEVFSTQPVLAVRDAYGNGDTDFAEVVTVRLSAGAGRLEGRRNQVVAKGTVDFRENALQYTAATDGEGFSLTVDDEPGGIDLTAATTRGLSADVIATQLAFVTQPDDLTEPGENFASPPVQVAAQDERGVTDADYALPVVIRAVTARDTSVVVDSLRAAPGDSVAPSGGVATWTELQLVQPDLIRLTATSDPLEAGWSRLSGALSRLTLEAAPGLVSSNVLAGRAGRGGENLVLNAFQVRAEGERVPIYAVDVKPRFTGLERGELHHLDLVRDLEANGAVDAIDASVLVAAVDPAGSGRVRTLPLADYVAPADSLLHFLVVADLDTTIRSGDALGIDIVGLSVGKGVRTGVQPVTLGDRVPGKEHVATSSVDLIAARLENPRPGQIGKVTLVFDTVSDLAAGDELVIDFPAGFDPSQAVVDAATVTPSGVDPGVSAEESGGWRTVLEVKADEPRGRYEVVLEGLRNPSRGTGAYTLDVWTRTDADVELDGRDPTPPVFQLRGIGRVEVSQVRRQRIGVGQEGKVDIRFTTSSSLAAGDEIVLTFPAGFDLRRAAVAAATQTPGGVDPKKNETESRGPTIVLDLQGDEAAGEYFLVLSGVVNPSQAARNRTLDVLTRRDDDAVVDREDETPPRFDVVGCLRLEAGKTRKGILEGLAGRGGDGLPLTGFALTAAGEDIRVEGVEVRPGLGGMGREAVRAFDVIGDANGNGRVDPEEGSVLVNAVDDEGRGASILLRFADHRIEEDGTRQYLLVADLSPTIASTDRIFVDVVRTLGGKGRVTEGDVVALGDRVAGARHTVTGRTDISQVVLENRGAGQSGLVTITFSTDSPLRAGDEIVVTFPVGFDLSPVRVEATPATPSGAGLQKGPAGSSRRVLVLASAGDEAAGEYRIALQGVVNPAQVQRNISVDVLTRRGDGTPVDGDDPTPFTFGVIPVITPCSCDFDGNGRVYAQDFFLFADAFGREGAREYDLDQTGKVDFDDFFYFADQFGQACARPLELAITVELPGGETMDFVLIRAGRFTRGSPDSEAGRDADEGPPHRVEISQPFYLGQYEVTQAQWEGVMGTQPWAGKPAVAEQADHPAVYLSWDDAQALVQRLNEAAGDSLYRLPTEAEWEYAARAGTTTRWSFGDAEGQLDDYAWVRSMPLVVSALTTHPAGTKQPNPWNLYDVHGSAAEWVQDFYGPYSSPGQTDPTGPDSGSSRVVKGGGGTLSAAAVRSASREAFPAAARLSTFGVRLVRRIP